MLCLVLAAVVAAGAVDGPSVHRGVDNNVTVKPPRLEQQVVVDGVCDGSIATVVVEPSVVTTCSDM